MKESTFNTLKEKLSNYSWPDIYMYKFIMPADSSKIARINALFDEDAEVKMAHSSNRNYVSITVNELAISHEEIIDKYVAASQIDGVMSL